MIVYEPGTTDSFGPLTALRHVGELRCGAFTAIDRLEWLAGQSVALWGRDAVTTWAGLRLDRPANGPLREASLLLDGRVIWNRLPALEPNTLGTIDGEVVAAHLPGDAIIPPDAVAGRWPDLPRVPLNDDGTLMRRPWDLVLRNGEQIAADVGLAKQRGQWQPTDPADHPQATFVGPDIVIEPGTVLGPGVVLDATPGPIVIGPDATVKANATIEGPCVIEHNTLVQHHAQIHEGVTIGPWCKVGGEVEASILDGYSNKQHYGFLGHSYIGQWVNLGAGCTTSDLKNTYGSVAVPLHGPETPVDTGSLFCGLTCGDYAKLGINTAVPTGAVIGTGSNVMGSRVPKFTPPLSWVVDGQVAPFDIEKAIAIAGRMMARRNRELTPAGQSLLRSLASS